MRMPHRSSLTPLLATLLAIGCGGQLPEDQDGQMHETQDDLRLGTRVHKLPKQDPAAITPNSAPAGAHLNYYGGRVIGNAKVVQVLWGTGSYLSNVTSTGTPSMATFYQQVMNSAHIDWLSDYNTNITPQGGGSGTNQSIGRGAFVQQVTITPSTSATTISDATIQSELAAKIQSGVLPAPTHDAAGNNNTYYAFFFPHGKVITQGGSNSCQAGGFCAYHGTVANVPGYGEVYYGVHPDMQSGSGCDTGCGNSSAFNNQTSVASHELVEAITDPEVGLATTYAPPLAWYDPTNAEIGDICNAQQGTIVGSDGVTYTVQKEFSNVANDCIVSRNVTPTNDFSVSVSPSTRSVNAGSSTTYTVSTTTTSGSAQTVSLTVSGLPSGVTGSFSPTSVSSGQSSTLTLTAASSAASATKSFTVTGSAASGSHTASASVTVVGSGGGGGGETVLTNGVALTGLSGATNAQSFFVLNVPAGQSSLVFNLSGGTGDADMYVNFGSHPSLSVYQCRPYVSGNTETCTFSNPAAGNWYVMLNGYAAYSGTSLKGTYSTTTDTTPALTNGVPVTGISGATSSQQFWKLTVPAGKSTLTFRISGGTGDADMYVKRGAKPTTSTYDCRPYLTGNSETCTFSSPVAADYYVMLRGYAAYSGVSLTGTYQ